MEGAKRRRRRHRRTQDRLKNLLIVLLSLSAFYLSVRSQLYSNLYGLWTGGLRSLLQSESAAPPLSSGGGDWPNLLPVRVTVCGHASGRFGLQYDQEQVNQLFQSVRGLLSEALAGARPPRQITEGEWQRSLGRSGVCFDFLGRIPLDALCTWLGEGAVNPYLNGAARRLLVAQGTGDSALLYYLNETDGSYYACETGLTYSGRMADLLEPYGGNGAVFAFEQGPQSAYSALDPYVLLLPAAPSPRIYRAGNPLSAGDGGVVERVQRALSFRPQADSSYSVTGGVRIREGKETLEILESGTVTYHAAEVSASRYVLGDGPSAGPAACAEAAWRLAESTIGSLCGSGQLYLMGTEETAKGTAVYLGYCLDGAAVRLSGDSYAAKFLIQEGAITDYTLRFRSYEDTGTRSLVLRELQAAAALEALSPQGRELLLCYTDSGGDTVEAGWVAG